MSEFFDKVIEFPDPKAKKLYSALVGIDEVKEHLIKEARLIFNPSLLESWSKKHHKKDITLLEYFKARTPLFIFAGDVGTGKTSLAETFGDCVARNEDISVLLYSLSLKTRGKGLVGEMTQLISSAFTSIEAEAKKVVKPGKKPGSAFVLLIDEADALAQSRESDHMNHEDKAGVNALIRGIDSIASEKLPVIIVLCTNRLNAIDPAVKRRAAVIFEFIRPGIEQRRLILNQSLSDLGFDEKELDHFVTATGPLAEREYGFTYSDLSQRLLPKILLDAFPDKPITFDSAVKVLEKINPTPPFKDLR